MPPTGLAPKKLSAKFYRRDTTTVARELLGCTLVHVVNGKRLAGRIVETEAYLGIEDKACHTFGDRRTERTRSMYLSGGHAYVYFIYGMHFCFNVVTRTEREPEAVLIRAIAPIENIELMRANRSRKTKSGKAPSDRDLANGPGKLCQALAIDRACDGLSLIGENLFIESAVDQTKFVESSKLVIEETPRIGVNYAGDHAQWLLRFLLR